MNGPNRKIKVELAYCLKYWVVSDPTLTGHGIELAHSRSV